MNISAATALREITEPIQTSLASGKLSVVMQKDPSPTEPTIVRDLADLPNAQYASFESMGLPTGSGLTETFAVYKKGEHRIILLVAEDSMLSHQRFDFENRLKQIDGVDKITILPASREIISVAHTRNSSVEEQDHTKVELKLREFLENAIAQGASDIHIETRTQYADVLFRIDGWRFREPTMSVEMATAMCNVLYTVYADNDAKKTAWDPRIVNNTTIPYELSDGTQ